MKRTLTSGTPDLDTTLPLRVVIFSRPGWLCKSLKNLLETLPQVGEPVMVNNPEELVATLENYHPQLVLLDGGLFPERLSVDLKFMARYYPQAYPICLAENSTQECELRSCAYGSVLLIGRPVSELVNLISDRVHAVATGISLQ